MRIAATWAFLELAGRDTAEAEVVARGAAQGPPPTRAGGQDDGSYTNSLKLVDAVKRVFSFGQGAFLGRN